MGSGKIRKTRLSSRALLHLRRSLSLEVTAEGIQTLKQLRELQSLACDEGQGYYFAKPQPSVAAALIGAINGDERAAAA